MLERLAPVTVARTLPSIAEIARAADEHGYWGLGISDSPLLYHEMYPVITWLLGQTERIRIGPNVTNPVSRHWTVHASTMRTFEDLAPGRTFLGFAAGDGAVHSVGRKPATRAELASIVPEMRSQLPRSTPIYLAASGPKMAATAGSVADGVILSTGADHEALRGLGDRARSAGNGPIEAWGLIYVDAVSDPADIAARLGAAAPVALAMSRFSFSETFDGKNVPPAIQDVIRRGFSEYSFGHHAEFRAENPNAHLFDEQPEVLDYLLRRFCVVDGPGRCLSRLTTILAEGALDGLWIVLGADDPVGTLRRLADAAS